jgi:hypothetical protein
MFHARYYIIDKNVHQNDATFQTLFIPWGSQAFPLDDRHVLLIPNVPLTTQQEGILHAHPDVARVQHPQTEHMHSFGDLVKNPAHGRKRFQQKHLDALKAIGISGKHTIKDLHDYVVKTWGPKFGLDYSCAHHEAPHEPY